MYNIIKKYFFLHHNLALPGIGNFSVKKIPAQVDFTDRTVSPDYVSIIFDADKAKTNDHFYNYIAHELKTNEAQAIKSFTEFSASLHSTLNDQKEFYLKGIGRLSKQTSNVISFQAENITSDFYAVLPAERVIRKNASHSVRVGEDEKTSVEMHSVLNADKVVIQKDNWWIAALILGIIGIAALAAYYIFIA